MANFRKYTLSSRIEILAGKSAQNNEELISQVKPKETVLHTKAPGSPFTNIKSLKPSKTDIKEAAVFTAKYSKIWRDKKSDVLIHVFKGSDIYKDKSMKTGTYGIKKFETIKIKKSEIQSFEKQLEKDIQKVEEISLKDKLKGLFNLK